jgi:hypothetical protein
MPMPAVIGENDVSYENGFYSSRSVTSRAQGSRSSIVGCARQTTCRHRTC